MQNKTAHHLTIHHLSSTDICTVHDRRAVVFAKAKLLVFDYTTRSSLPSGFIITTSSSASLRILFHSAIIFVLIFVLIRPSALFAELVLIVRGAAMRFNTQQIRDVHKTLSHMTETRPNGQLSRPRRDRDVPFFQTLKTETRPRR